MGMPVMVALWDFMNFAKSQKSIKMLDFDQFCSKIHQKLKNRENLQVKKSSKKNEKSKIFKNFKIFRDEKQSETARNSSKHHTDQHNRPESKNQDLSKRNIFFKKWSFRLSQGASVSRPYTHTMRLLGSLYIHNRQCRYSMSFVVWSRDMVSGKDLGIP